MRVLVAEDHFVTREGLRRLLEEQPDIEVGFAGFPKVADLHQNRGVGSTGRLASAEFDRAEEGG